jgi:hypothetical protein
MELLGEIYLKRTIAVKSYIRAI